MQPKLLLSRTRHVFHVFHVHGLCSSWVFAVSLISERAADQLSVSLTPPLFLSHIQKRSIHLRTEAVLSPPGQAGARESAAGRPRTPTSLTNKPQTNPPGPPAPMQPQPSPSVCWSLPAGFLSGIVRGEMKNKIK